MGPLDDQSSGTEETWLRRNVSRYILEQRDTTMLSHDTWFMKQDSGFFLVTMHGKYSNGE